MRPKSLILLALALGCGLVASIGISQVMEKNRGESKELETEAIYVAKQDIRDGDKLTEQVLELEQWPKAKIPAGAMVKKEEWENQKTKVALFKGEPIIKAKLFDKTTYAATNIPVGKCTVSVAVDAVISGGGLIRPRDYVDVLVVMTKNPSMGINETGVKTILKNIEIFAVDSQYKRGDAGEETAIGKVVSLLVTPKQAKAVTLSAEVGKIRLVLKPPDMPDASKGENGPDDVELTIRNLGTTNDPTPQVAAPKPEESSLAQPEPLKPKSGNILDVINEIKNHPESVDPVAADPNKPQPWTMVLLEAGNAREVVFNDGSGLPASSRKVFEHEATPPASPREKTP